MKKNGFWIGVICIIILGIVLIFSNFGNEELVGGKKDEHGCLGAAGYNYDGNIGACTRDWELNENQAKAAKIAVEYLGAMKGATIDSVTAARCPGCYIVDVKLHLNSGDKEVKVNIENWEIVKPETELSPDDCIAKGGRTLNTVGGDSCNDDEVNIGPVVGFISPNICCIPGARLTEEEAVEIAENSKCVDEGELTDNIMYNENTDTYWIDMVLKEEKPGCMPACVVYEAYKKAVINYRCTGALPPEE